MTEAHESQIPYIIISKLVNRRRRQLRLEQIGAPPLLTNGEARLVNEALDELSAWAEEHRPGIFYSRKEEAVPDESDE